MQYRMRESLKIVMKFGGSSLANTARVRRAARIVQRFSAENKIVVVVSAMDDVTDRLVEIEESVLKGENSRVRTLLSKLQRFHAITARSIARERPGADPVASVSLLSAELQKTVNGILHLREVTPRSRDYLLSFGERFALPIFASALRAIGLKARPMSGGEAGIATDDNFGEAKPLVEVSYNQLRKRLEPFLI